MEGDQLEYLVQAPGGLKIGILDFNIFGIRVEVISGFIAVNWKTSENIPILHQSKTGRITNSFLNG